MVNRVAFAPPPGVKFGETDYSIPGQYCAVNNMRFVNGRPQTIGGWDHITASAAYFTGHCVAMQEWIADDSGIRIRRLVFGNTGNLAMVYGDDLESAQTITPATFSSSTANRWTFDLWGQNLIACWSNTTGHFIYEWDPDVGGLATPVTNAPARTKIAGVSHTRQLFAFGCDEEASGNFNGRCIRWSDVEDNTAWTTTAANLAGEYILDGSGGSIRCVKKIGTNWAVWTDDELFLGSYTSDPSNPWVFERQATGCGTKGTHCATVADGVAYWISSDLRLMMWVPGTTPVAIAGMPTSHLSSVFSATFLTGAFVWHNSQFGEIWFHGGTTLYPTSYVSVNVSSIASGNPIWSGGSLARTCMYQGINGCYGYGQSSAKVYTHEAGAKNGHTGDLLAWSIEALVYMDEGQNRVQIQRLLPDIESQVGNVTFTLSAMDYPQGTETTLQTKTLAVSDDKVDFRAGGKLFRLKFSGNDGVGATDTFARLGKMAFEFVPEGER